MAAGWMTWTCLLLAASTAGAEDVCYMNQRSFRNSGQHIRTDRKRNNPIQK